MQQILDVLSAHGLGHLHRGHTQEGEVVLLNLQGVLHVDQLLSVPTFVAYAAAESMPPELWGGEQLEISTSPAHVVEVKHQDERLVALIESYIGEAEWEVQPTAAAMKQSLEVHISEVEYVEVVSAPQVPLSEMTMEERLDRARALRGKWVAEPPHHSIADREAERERVSRMAPGVTYRDLHPLDDDDYEPPTPYDIAMRRIRRVEGAPDSLLAPDDGAPRSREEDWYYHP